MIKQSIILLYFVNKKRILLKGGYMISSQAILFALLLSVITNATDTSLNTNTNFLLLMLLALAGNNNNSNSFSSCSQNTCPNSFSFI